MMNQLTMEEIKVLNEKAKNIRIDILKSITKANSGHTGGSLSIADLLTLLFFHEMNINPANPKMENRDRLVISKGHGAPALYAALAEKGYFPKEEMDFLQGKEKIDKLISCRCAMCCKSSSAKYNTRKGKGS